MMDGKRYVVREELDDVTGLHVDDTHSEETFKCEFNSDAMRLADLLNRLQADSDELARIRAEAKAVWERGPRGFNGPMLTPDILRFVDSIRPKDS